MLSTTTPNRSRVYPTYWLQSRCSSGVGGSGKHDRDRCFEQIYFAYGRHSCLHIGETECNQHEACGLLLLNSGSIIGLDLHSSHEFVSLGSFVADMCNGRWGLAQIFHLLAPGTWHRSVFSGRSKKGPWTKNRHVQA